ncbi:sugar transferase [Candidatus Uhrbacteria bacterium]|nr:sugar transferase [Candidatus Uhrbacteria bacterium]
MKRVDLVFAAAAVPLDYVALVGAAALAYSLRFADAFETLRPVVFDLPFSSYMQVALPAAIGFIVVYALAGLYRLSPRGIAAEATRVILATSTGFAAVLAVAFFSRTLFESRFIMLAAWALALLFVVAERVMLRGLQQSLRTFGIGCRNVAIIGKTKSGNALHDFFRDARRLGYRPVLHVANFADAKNKLLTLRRHGTLDMVVMANPDADRREVEAVKAFTDIEHLTFAYSADLVPSGTARPIIHTFAGRPVIEVPQTPLDGWGAIYKRAFDIVLSAILIIITLPFQILIALAIVIENPGPVFFRLNRVGQRGEEFPFLKFRTMVRDAHKLRFDPEFIKKYGNERGGSPLFKLKDDPRVTRVGRFLRASSLDEIPQFYLVLLGSMSLVGPRPHLPEEVAVYKPEHRRVLTIKPGITGMAQTGGRASLDFEDEVRLDMYYIENWSPWLDLIILLKTPLAVLFRRGAY